MAIIVDIRIDDDALLRTPAPTHGRLCQRLRGVHLDDCVLCQFLNLIYTTTVTLTVAIPVCLTTRVVTSNVNTVFCEVRQNDSTRAPPFIL